jgi:alanine dehydrogenase
MTLFLDSGDIRSLAADDVCEQAAWAAVRAESSGRTRLPGRIDLPCENGFLRVMPAVLGPVMGLKVMSLAEGIGNRYLVLLFDAQSGELRGALDADELTRLRTAAFTATAARLMVGEGDPRNLGLIGSGFEAGGHLRALCRLWSFDSVSVFSPSRERREAFATRQTADLGVKVTAVESPDGAVREADLVMIATKSKTPVLDGAHIRHGAVVLSVGSTRPNLRELDAATMRRTGTMVVDDPAQVRAESGDIMSALRDGDVTEERLVSVARIADGPELLRREDGRDLLTFKSVGTALQDLALAELLVGAAEQNGVGRELGELAALKPFADNSVRVS